MFGGFFYIYSVHLSSADVLSVYSGWSSEVLFLDVAGGHKEFHRRHKEFCEDTLLPPSGRPMVSCPSPSDSVLTPDIDSHPASRVLPFLYLGNQQDAADLNTLRSLGVTRVLNVTSHLPGYHEACGITYKQLPASDSGHQNLKQYFEEAFDFIGESFIPFNLISVPPD